MSHTGTHRDTRATQPDWYEWFITLPSRQPRTWRAAYAAEGREALKKLREVDPVMFGPIFSEPITEKAIESGNFVVVNFIIQIAIALVSSYFESAVKKSPYWKIDVMRETFYIAIPAFLTQQDGFLHQYPITVTSKSGETLKIQSPFTESLVYELIFRYRTSWDPKGRYQFHNNIKRPIDEHTVGRFEFPHIAECDWTDKYNAMEASQ